MTTSWTIVNIAGYPDGCLCDTTDDGCYTDTTQDGVICTDDPWILLEKP